MNKEELEAMAYKDFREMSPRVQVAFDRYKKSFRYCDTSRTFLHSISENHTFRTRTGNTWHIMFRHEGVEGNRQIFNCVSYAVFPRDKGTDYLFLIGPMDHFIIELLSAHFLKRYHERYLVPNQVNLRGMNMGLYFFLNNPSRDEAFFMPERGEEVGAKERNFLLLKQGMARIRVDGHILTYITFLASDDLTLYKQKIQEERELVMMMNTLTQPIEKMPLQFVAVFSRLLKDKERTLGLLESIHRRTLLWGSEKNQNNTRLMWKFMEEQWDYLDQLFSGLRKRYEGMQLNKKKSLLDCCSDPALRLRLSRELGREL